MTPPFIQLLGPRTLELPLIPVFFSCPTSNPSGNPIGSLFKLFQNWPLLETFIATILAPTSFLLDYCKDSLFCPPPLPQFLLNTGIAFKTKLDHVTLLCKILWFPISTKEPVIILVLKALKHPFLPLCSLYTPATLAFFLLPVLYAKYPQITSSPWVFAQLFPLPGMLS